MLGVAAPDDTRDFTNAIAITSSIYPKPEVHIEPVTYGRGADSQSLGFWLMTEAGRRGTQPLHLLLNLARHPLNDAAGHARARLVAADGDRAVHADLRQPHEAESRPSLAERQPDPHHRARPIAPNPDKVPEAYHLASWLAKRLGGTPQAVFPEAILSIPTTAHILGGAVIGASPQTRVIDSNHRVFGYENLLVCDGSAISANPGVNPSLTITALTERAMSRIPARAKRSLHRRPGSPTAKIKLHRCRFTFLYSKALSACYRVQSALDEQGIEYDVVKQPYLPRGRRKAVISLSGQQMLPVVEFEDGSAYRAESTDMAATIRDGRLFEKQPVARPSKMNAHAAAPTEQSYRQH